MYLSRVSQLSVPHPTNLRVATLISIWIMVHLGEPVLLRAAPAALPTAIKHRDLLLRNPRTDAPPGIFDLQWRGPQVSWGFP
jgi:hypothetical protein